MSEKHLKDVASTIRTLGEEVRKHLGCGFIEDIFQKALAIELRKKKIDYLKEVNIEIFYKNESVGADRPDFIITKAGGCRKPIILELKVADKITDNHRIQLRSYCTSLPRNNNPVLTDFIGGILMSFPACDMASCGSVKVFAVDRRFNTLIDDQAEEDEEARVEREKRKK